MATKKIAAPKKGPRNAKRPPAIVRGGRGRLYTTREQGLTAAFTLMCIVFAVLAYVRY